MLTRWHAHHELRRHGHALRPTLHTWVHTSWHHHGHSTHLRRWHHHHRHTIIIVVCGRWLHITVLRIRLHGIVGRLLHIRHVGRAHRLQGVTRPTWAHLWESIHSHVLTRPTRLPRRRYIHMRMRSVRGRLCWRLFVWQFIVIRIAVVVITGVGR